MSADTLTIVATQFLTTLGIVYFLVQRMDTMGRDLRQDLGGRIHRVEARIDHLEADMGRRFDAQTARIDRLEADIGGRIDAQSARIDAHIERHPS